MTPSFSGRIAWIVPGVRPSMRFASTPTACTSPVRESIATTEGSERTMPRPRTYTSVLAVPRSTAMSRPPNPVSALKMPMTGPESSCDLKRSFDSFVTRRGLPSTYEQRELDRQPRDRRGAARGRRGEEGGELPARRRTGRPRRGSRLRRRLGLGPPGRALRRVPEQGTARRRRRLPPQPLVGRGRQAPHENRGCRATRRLPLRPATRRRRRGSGGDSVRDGGGGDELTSRAGALTERRLPSRRTGRRVGRRAQ